jgi:hypothetical protein
LLKALNQSCGHIGTAVEIPKLRSPPSPSCPANVEATLSAYARHLTIQSITFNGLNFRFSDIVLDKNISILHKILQQRQAARTVTTRNHA